MLALLLVIAAFAWRGQGQAGTTSRLLFEANATSTGSQNRFLPLYSCTEKAALALRKRFSFAPHQQDGSKCPTWGFFFAAMYRADSSTNDKLMIAVGVGKGYSVVHFHGVWGTINSKVLTFGHWATQLSAMHDQGRTVSDYVCGDCKECQDKLYLHSNNLPVRTDALLEERSRDLRPQLSMPHFVGIDPNPRNIHSLQRISKTFGLPVLGISAFISNATGPDLWLEPQHWGDESASLQPVAPRTPEATAVPVRTLDALLSELQTNGTLVPAQNISILTIDTGRDAQVLKGAQRTLKSGRVRVLVFTYAGEWPAGRSLQAVVTDVSETMNASCYLLGSSKTWKLTSGCWDGIYGQRKGANVACVTRGDVWERVLDSLCVRVKAKESR